MARKVNKQAELVRAFGKIDLKKVDNRTISAQVQGWHGNPNGGVRAELKAEGRDAMRAMSALFDLVSGMAELPVQNGETKHYPDRYTTQNGAGDDITYHSGDDARYERGFYLNGVKKRMR